MEQTKDDVFGSFAEYTEKMKAAEEALKKQQEELKRVANRVFSTEDGRVLARAMIRSCRMLDVVESGALSDNDLRNLMAYRDFVNTFITKLVDRKVFMSILEEI